MARTEFIKSARKTKTGARPTCCTCDEPIAVGQSYYRNQPSRFSGAYSWHVDCAPPAPSALESNDKRARAMEAFEAAAAELAGLDPGSYAESDALLADVGQIIEDCATGVREAAEMWTESADSIEDGFGHSTSQSDELREHAEVYEGVADEVEAVEREDWDDGDDFAEWAQGVIDAVAAGLDDAAGGLD